MLVTLFWWTRAYMLNYIHANHLRYVFLPEVIMNTCNVQFQGILYNIYIVPFYFWYFYPSTTLRFTCINLDAFLSWLTCLELNTMQLFDSKILVEINLSRDCRQFWQWMMVTPMSVWVSVGLTPFDIIIDMYLQKW